MNCFLHIGTEKTATTTLQSFFYLNRIKMLKYGFLFPKSVGIRNNYKLPVAVYNINKRDDLTNRLNIFSDNNLISFQKRVINNLKKEIFFNNNQNIIFSSEHIQSRLTDINELYRLKNMINGLGFDDILIIIYLRNPVEIAESLYSTSIINGHTISVPPPSSNRYFNNICNHKNTLMSYERVFGKDNLIPRIYDRNEFKNNSIIEDFLEVLGLRLSEEFEIPNDENRSLSFLGLEILRRFNKKVPLFINNKLNPKRSDIVNYFQRYFSDKKYLMPKYLVDEYEKAFEESNEWVRRNWFPVKESLFPKKVYFEEEKTNCTDTELKKIADLLADIWSEK
jgi:hypothetical protein